MELTTLITNIFSEVKATFSSLPPTINLPFTYYSQWESPRLVDKFIYQTLPVSKDPQWKKSGASTPKDYEYWSWNLCGIACLRMVLAGKKIPVPPAVTLAKKSIKYGCYTPTPDFIGGLFYKPFINFLTGKFHLQSIIANPLSIKRIKYYLSQKCYVIASISPQIRNPDSHPAKKGGHLVLITGYNSAAKTLTFQNPSGFYRKSQQNVLLSESVFSRFFANRGIIVK
jgi:hypothetical protein